MSLVLNLLNKALVIFLCLLVPLVSVADPVISGEIVAPGSFTYVDDDDLLRRLGFDVPVWCYESESNAVLLAAPEKERRLCTLRVQNELDKQEAKFNLKVSNLELRIETLQEQHDSMLRIKMKEIESLQEIAVSKPNNYWYLFLSGGVVVGVLSTFFIMR